MARLRTDRGLTQRQLAESAAISVTFLSELENGKRNVSADVLLRVAEALGASPDYLLRGVGEEASESAFPDSLARAAENGGWSYAEAAALLAAHRAVGARRSRQIRRDLSEEDWHELHRRFFGESS